MARNAKAINTESGKSNMEAPTLDPGAYPARVVQVIFLGVQEQRPYKGQAKDPVDEVLVQYELSDEFMLDEEGNELTDKPRWFSETVPFYGLAVERAKSTKRYNAIDPSDSCDGDFYGLVGMPCQVVLVKNPGRGKHEGKIFNNIGDVTPAPKMKGYVQPELVNPVTTFDPQAEDVSEDAFNAIPEFIRNKIISALDFTSSPLAKLLGKDEEPSTEPSESEIGEDEVL